MALFVGRIPRDMNTRDLEDTFTKYGKITRLDVKKGFGFVEYEDKRDAEDAIKAINDRGELVVEWAKNGGKRPGENECFHCGKEGHWARDCVEGGRDREGGGGGSGRGGARGGRGGYGRDRSPRRDGGRGYDRDNRRDNRDFDRRRDDRGRDRSPRRNDYRDRGFDRRPDNGGGRRDDNRRDDRYGGHREERRRDDLPDRDQQQPHLE